MKSVMRSHKNYFMRQTSSLTFTIKLKHVVLTHERAQLQMNDSGWKHNAMAWSWYCKLI